MSFIKFFEYCSLHWMSRFLGYVPLLGLNTEMGRSFKSYLIEENMPERIANLKRGMDSASSRTADRCIYRMLHDPEFFGHRKRNEQIFVKPSNYLEEDELVYARQFLSELPELRKQYKMLTFEHSPEATFAHNGLRSLNEKAREYLKGKDFIDGGAYIGDSAITFAQYQPRKIYSFDISEVHRKIYEQTLQKNQISPKQYEFVVSGLYDYENRGDLTENSGLDCSLQGKDPSVLDKIQLTTLDHFREERNLNVGFFKLDIEGSEPQAVRGAAKTIQECRPILSISVYHNPESFFEIKPFLESLDIDYTYKILQLAPPCLPKMPFAHKGWWRLGVCSFGETCLFAYPKELAENKEIID